MVPKLIQIRFFFYHNLILYYSVDSKVCVIRLAQKREQKAQEYTDFVASDLLNVW